MKENSSWGLLKRRMSDLGKSDSRRSGALNEGQRDNASREFVI
ncbi:MAG: hypothetical protein ACOC10_11185 [Bacteroidota bacterium]